MAAAIRMEGVIVFWIIEVFTVGYFCPELGNLKRDINISMLEGLKQDGACDIIRTHVLYGGMFMGSHLHVHSEFSFLDGFCRLPELVGKARERGFKALAVTDHMNMSGAVEFYRLACSEQIKPIMGVEVVLRRQRGDYHLVLLAKNNLGYTNILELVSLAHLNRPQHPHITWEELKDRSAGLIVMSGCEEGEIPSMLQEGEWHRAVDVAAEYRNIFGKNNFFLEMVIAFPDSLQKRLLRLSAECSLPLAASNDVHYLKPGEEKVQHYLLVLQRISRGTFPKRSGGRYLLGKQEMEQACRRYPQAYKNAESIAERCNVTLDLEEMHLPHFPLEPGQTADSFLENRCWHLHEEKKKDDSRYRQRLQAELGIIKKTGFAGYFLIVGDIFSFCRKKNIPAQVRGSAVGSYIGYLLNFSSVDPVEYGLYFERFLNPERISMPDIDLDISHHSRKEVLSYLQHKYGRERMAHVAAYSTFAGRAALHDAAKALGLGEDRASNFSSLIKRPHALLEENFKMSAAIQEHYEREDDFCRAFNLARRLEKLPRHLTQHSAGVVLARDRLTNYTALQYSRDGEVITQFDMHSIEALGLLKIDLLGSRFQSVIHSTVKEVKKKIGLELVPWNFPTRDFEVFKAIQEARTMGIFQLESTGMRLLLGQLRPESLKDLIAATSLYRPGPLKSGMATRYIRRRRGREKVKPLHPSLSQVLQETFGTVIWQEQVMQTARIMAGYSLGEADLLRRATGKKIPAEMGKHRERFVAACQERGIRKREAVEVFKSLEHFSSYCFNKAHAAAYAQLIYQTAYLKVHFPLEYMTSLMNMHLFDTGRINRYLGECRRLGIKLLGPHINRSFAGFCVEEKGIRAGLSLVKNLGPRGVEAILQEREKGEFLSFHDFLHRLYERGLNRAGIEALIKVGAFSSFGEEYHFLWQFPTFLAYLRKTTGDKKNLLLNSDLPLKDFGQRLHWKQKMIWEAELLGHFITSHPLDVVSGNSGSAEVFPLASLYDSLPGKSFLVEGLVTGLQVRKSKRGGQVYMVELEDRSGSAEIVFFSDLVGADHRFFRGGKILLIEVVTSLREGVFQVTARKIVEERCLKDLLTG